MTSGRRDLGELRDLVDRFFDGTLDAAGIAKIDHLIVHDQASLQAYVERFDFHGELIEQADCRSPEETSLAVLTRFSDACEIRESRSRRRLKILMTVCTLMTAVGLGWLYYSVILVPPPLGTIASLSTELQSDRKLELGQIVRWGQTIQISQGVVSLQLADVMIDLVGPVSVKLERQGEVYLNDGTVVARVEPAGKGFTVRTQDAEVVDLGTEFLVHRDAREGTHVSVRQGEAHAKLLDWRGASTKVIELTASRTAELNRATEVVKETAYDVDRFLPVDRTRKGIRRLTGTLRTLMDVPASLESDQLTTPNHILIIPERQVHLDAPLTVNTISGPLTIPAGTTVSSYLIHYDPTDAVSFAPRGSVTFFGQIAGIIGTSAPLAQTDPLFGNSNVQFEQQEFRQLELDEDELQFSEDRKTVSFYFGVSPPRFIDEARILVIDSDQ